MNERTEPSRTQEDYTLYDLWTVAWGGRWLIVAIVAIGVGLSVAYALTAEKWYRAHAVLMHADNDSGGMSSSFGGLAALADIGGFEGGGLREQAMAVLSSRDFAADFIRRNDLLEVFAPPENAEAPDIREAVRFFHEDVFRIDEDTNTGRVTLSVFWTDAETAATWAGILVGQINERMRQRALTEAETNVEFLQEQLTGSSVVALQQSVSNLLENELQTLMLVKGAKEYAFMVVDPAQPPMKRVRPKRTLIVLTSAVLSGVLAIAIVFVRSALRKGSR